MNQIGVWSIKHPVMTREDFGRLWLTRSHFEMRENRSRGEVIDQGETLIGAHWRRTGSLSGRGYVQFRPVADNTRSNSVVIESNHRRSVEWLLLFEKLIEVLAPSYAMLHLFMGMELTNPTSHDHFTKFDGPFAGEEHFTSWKSSLGDWRRPDQWDLKARRQYRYLPELSWANFLGREFDGQYDLNLIKKSAVNAKTIGGGFVFQATKTLSDVEKFPEQFNRSRTELKQAFVPGFFRR